MTGLTRMDSATAHGGGGPEVVVDHRYLPPPPVELPRLVPGMFRSRRAVAVIIATLLVAGGVGAFFAVRALTPDQSSGAIAQLTNRYRQEASVLDASVATFKAALRDATQSGDASQLSASANALSADLLHFDAALDGMKFPIRMRRDADAVIAADQTLRADLDGTSPSTQDPARTFQSDYDLAGQAHDALNSDLGLPASAFGSSSTLTA